MRIVLTDFGRSLISRVRGQAVRDAVLRDIGDARVVELDFSGIQNVSYSFVDELVGNLVSMHEAGHLAAEVRVTNSMPMTAMHVQTCLDRRASSRPLVA